MKDIAVIGCGYWGKNLVRNFYNLKALYSVCDADVRKKSEIKIKYRDIDFTSSYEKVLKDAAVKAVAIATPARSHFLLVKKALLHNKDVFVEKPLALRLSDGEALVRLAKKRNKILMIDHLLRYHPAIEELKKLISHGKLGAIEYIYSNRLNIGKFRKEENILWSFAPHDISVILALTESMPKDVCAFGAAYLQKRIYDTTITTLCFAGKLKAHIFVSWLHPFKEQKLVVIGTKNMAVFNDGTQDKLVLFPHKVKWDRGVPVASKALSHEVIRINTCEPLKNACRHFIYSIKKRISPLTDGKEALRVLRVLRDAQVSLEANNCEKRKK